MFIMIETQSSLYSLIVPLDVLAANAKIDPFFFQEEVVWLSEGMGIPSDVITFGLIGLCFFWEEGLKFLRAD